MVLGLLQTNWTAWAQILYIIILHPIRASNLVVTCIHLAQTNDVWKKYHNTNPEFLFPEWKTLAISTDPILHMIQIRSKSPFHGFRYRVRLHKFHYIMDRRPLAQSTSRLLDQRALWMCSSIGWMNGVSQVPQYQSGVTISSVENTGHIQWSHTAHDSHPIQESFESVPVLFFSSYFSLHNGQKTAGAIHC